MDNLPEGKLGFLMGVVGSLMHSIRSKDEVPPPVEPFLVHPQSKEVDAERSNRERPFPKFWENFIDALHKEEQLEIIWYWDRPILRHRKGRKFFYKSYQGELIEWLITDMSGCGQILFLGSIKKTKPENWFKTMSTEGIWRFLRACNS
ncbi:MAG: hypothetical protein FD189_2488 [Elusimicrobia bacterium]|nr:MAG: hypothetical protein FD154_1543 [Elusimicrobiota bacterium]KAF0152340.1 MAG: hypothetical protein FD189_2488 [Elusimicrobiota bacterium]